MAHDACDDGKCGELRGVFRDISLADGGSPLQIQALRNVYEGRGAASGNEAAGDNRSGFQPSVLFLRRLSTEKHNIWG